MSFTDGEFTMDLDFNEAVKPAPRTPIPAGNYPFVIENYRVEVRSGWQIVTMFHQVEGGEHDGRVVFHDIFMPNREKQTPEQYNKALGRIQEYLESLMGSPVQGNVRFNPAALVGARGMMEVGVRKDKIPGDEGIIDGVQQYYDPRNTLKKVVAQGTQATPQATQAQPFQLPTPGQPMAAPPSQVPPFVQPTQPMMPPMMPSPAPTPSAPQPVAPAAQMAPAPVQQAPSAPSPSEQPPVQFIPPVSPQPEAAPAPEPPQAPAAFTL